MTIQLRRKVKWFARQMEITLRRHDKSKGKEGWRNMDIMSLIADLKSEVNELDSDLFPWYNTKEIIRECTDIANFAMMIADNCRNRDR